MQTLLLSLWGREVVPDRPQEKIILQKMAKGRNDSTCPKSFSCGNLTDLSFPFSLSTQPDCGIVPISGCDAKPFPRIQLLPGGEWYYARGKEYSHTIFLVDPKLQTILRKNKCQAFNENISISDSPSISYTAVNLQNFYKCNRTSSNNPYINQTMKGHFDGYDSYDGCDGLTIYYKFDGVDDEDILAGNHTANCSLIRLPYYQTEPGDDNLVNFLHPEFLVEWKLSDDCNECHYGGGRCQTDKKNNFLCYKGTEPCVRQACLHSKLNTYSPSIINRLFRLIGDRFYNLKLINVGVANVAGTSKRGYLQTIWFKVATDILLTVSLPLRFWESNNQDHQRVEEFLKNYGSYTPNRYNYTDIKRITGRFRNKLGQGGFGNVYRGSLCNGSQVAVKVLNELKGSAEDFINEVASISRTSHVNIVTLVGFCFEGHKRALVYEFMPNGSLEKFIYEERSDSVRQLSWPILYKIALGIARGLEYLHRGCNTRILHFDIKPHNILLDDNFCPKISDFGLAKLCMKQESIVSMLGPRGTIGYIAPEIVCRNLGGVSHKSDVYSYGMMVLEMVGGRKNVDVGVDCTSEIYFPHWLYRRIELDEELQLIGIMNEEENECARKMVISSLWCIQTDPANRPSMSKVVEMLEGKLDSLQMPPKPYLYSPSRSEVDSSILELTTTTYPG
ncbi:hypothetical protein H5410_025371 [Solanum commersonii]|uniref:Protein kinase domain-containing protein n=1 Tax=Solanum commersonii TaxID=4109 RepID=A0A9J5YVS6_SOLCO|nr:hypothetical protein H5410_025371 [Solanum commersonii]